MLHRWRRQRAQVLDHQIALARVAAPTGGEQDRAARVRQWLEALPDLSVGQDIVGNVWAIVPPDVVIDPRPLVCLSHLDTVYAGGPAPIAITAVDTAEGTELRGPGIGDNGRGLAALIALAGMLTEPAYRARLNRPVHLVATVGEEGDGNLRGARAWFDAADARGERPYAAIAIDGPGDETIVHHAVGSRRLRVSFTGPGGHSWVDGTAPNPLHALGLLITRIDALQRALARRAHERTTVHVTRMHGGESLTAIPQTGWIDIDLRSSQASTLDDVPRELMRLAHDVAGPFAVHLTVLGERPCGSVAANHPLVRSAMIATEAVGRRPQSAMASTDANIPLARGIPAIAIGAGGSGGGAHTASEWYRDDPQARGLARMAKIVVEGVMSDGA